MVFMLAANRYYAVCRYQFYGLYFTPAKIRCYSIAILIFVVITGVSKLFEYCVIDVVGVNLQKTIQYGSLAVFVIIGCPVITFQLLFVTQWYTENYAEVLHLTTPVRIHLKQWAITMRISLKLRKVGLWMSLKFRFWEVSPYFQSLPYRVFSWTTF